MAAADVIKKIETKLESLETLTISTEIGDRKIRTEIHLLTGDLVTTMHQDFITGDLQSVREFHDKQIAKAESIVTRNIEAIVNIAKQIIHAQRGES